MLRPGGRGRGGWAPRLRCEGPPRATEGLSAHFHSEEGVSAGGLGTAVAALPPGPEQVERVRERREALCGPC